MTAFSRYSSILAACLFSIAAHFVASADDEFEFGTFRSLPRTLDNLTVKKLDETSRIPVGLLEFGKSYNFVVPILNATSLDWKISKTVSDCGCTVGVPSSREIKKNEPGRLAVVLRPKSEGDVNVRLSIELQNHPETKLDFLLIGKCRSRFSLTSREFRVNGESTDISCEIVSNFSDFPPGAIINCTACASIQLQSMKDKSRRRFLCTLDSTVVDRDMRMSTFGMTISVGDEVDEKTIAVVREHVVELRPRILVFKERDSYFEANVYIKCDENALAKLQDEQPIRWSVNHGDDTQNGYAALLVKHRSGNSAIGLVRVLKDSNVDVRRFLSGSDIVWNILDWRQMKTSGFLGGR